MTVPVNVGQDLQLTTTIMLTITGVDWNQACLFSYAPGGDWKQNFWGIPGRGRLITFHRHWNKMSKSQRVLNDWRKTVIHKLKINEELKYYWIFPVKLFQYSLPFIGQCVSHSMSGTVLNYLSIMHKSIFGRCKKDILHKVEPTFVLDYVSSDYHLFDMVGTKKVLIY